MAKVRGEEPPSLNALVERFGGYDKITDAGWAEFDAAYALYESQVHEKHRIAPSTIAAGVHYVHVRQDQRAFSHWLDRMPDLYRREVARGIWRALKTPSSRTRLEEWMKIYIRDRGEH